MSSSTRQSAEAVDLPKDIQACLLDRQIAASYDYSSDSDKDNRRIHNLLAIQSYGLETNKNPVQSVAAPRLRSTFTESKLTRFIENDLLASETYPGDMSSILWFPRDIFEKYSEKGSRPRQLKPQKYVVRSRKENPPPFLLKNN